MKRTGTALLASIALLGCEPRLIDALQTADASDAMGDANGDALGDAMDGSTTDAVVDAPPEGGTTGPLAYYSFDEGTGSTVHDGSGNGRDGTLLGGTWTTGKFGDAIRFAAPGDAGVDGGIEDGVLVDPFPPAVTNWSVSFWLLINASDLTAQGTVLSTEATFMGGWEVNVTPHDATLGTLEFAFWSGSGYSSTTCACVKLGSWTHIVAVVDGSSLLTVQLFQDTVPAPPNPGQQKFFPGLTHLYMGRWGGVGDRPLVGVLDEVAIFDRALSTTEIGQLYAGVIP
jgi:hypothetical protein